VEASSALMGGAENTYRSHLVYSGLVVKCFAKKNTKSFKPLERYVGFNVGGMSLNVPEGP